MWKAARTVDSKPAPFAITLLGPAVVAITGGIPHLRDITGSLSLIVGGVYMLAAATTLWLGREERLTARWPLILLSAAHGAALLIGTYTTFSGSTGQDIVPSLASLFGFIYFETVIYALGTSVFLLVLFKERSEAVSRHAARIDPLTGIANRTGFIESARRVLERGRRDGAPVAVMMFDLDRFKSINDSYGHATGDAVIKRFCEITASLLRPTDVFGRLGGEEFVVVLPGSSIEAACVRAEGIRVSFAENCRSVMRHQVNATVSGGVSVSGDVDRTLDALLETSDMALYAAKADGRNRIKRADQPRPEGGSSNVFRVA
jgi:diguanylate cyclase (GGDEF)-like protein